MSKAIEQLKNGLLVGHAGLGMHGAAVGSVRQVVHDGDTINTRLIGNLGTRFLGVDAAEISFTLPGKSTFTAISDPRWEDFLSDPFNAVYGDFNAPMSAGLRGYLETRVGPGTAANHSMHAAAAQTALETEVLYDIALMGETNETFQFFLAFSHEVMDRYGRMLCFINRNQPDENTPAPRPLSYNERLLMAGIVTPYFIWPNISPFRKYANILEAVIQPFTANQLNDTRLNSARAGYQATRQAQVGVYAADHPLRLYPFELRFLAQRRLPNRWLIDLGKSDDHLVPPEEYFTIANPEDRLYIPEEYIWLFKEYGWKI